MLFSKAHIISPSMWWGFRMRADRWVILNWVSSSRKLLSPESIVKGICLGKCSSRRPACTETKDRCWTEIVVLSCGVWLPFCKAALHRKAFYSSLPPLVSASLSASYTTAKGVILTLHLFYTYGNRYREWLPEQHRYSMEKFLKTIISEPSPLQTSCMCRAF